ncbi:uncharacterized protein si:ch73-364h19.1 [Osmerus mordax]|uniref:uncharacterized protein si:ch73-364h19.1 n=1 Tax=Osmerus mordax TaxID=8014 RepID=UPI00350F2056
MSTGNTTTPSLRSDQLTIIVASFSSIVFFVVVVVLLAIVYRKDPLCCRARSYQASHGDMEVPPQYYSSRQTLVGSPCLEHTHSIMGDNAPPGQLFYVGLPSSYRLPPLEDSLPRLPSYESVRKKDRQRHIHMMIADRFGLNSSDITEAPPTYEESVRQSMEASYDVEAAHLPPPEDPDTEPDALPGRPTLTPSPHDGPLPV